jgi:hypothetical protein
MVELLGGGGFEAILAHEGFGWKGGIGLGLVSSWERWLESRC